MATAGIVLGCISLLMVHLGMDALFGSREHPGPFLILCHDSLPIPRWRKWLLAGIIAAVAAGTRRAVLLRPGPLCHLSRLPLARLTGWDCPGCGTLRAAHQLTHGNLAAAWRLNPLAVALAPVAFWLGLRELAWQLARKKMARPGDAAPFWLGAGGDYGFIWHRPQSAGVSPVSGPAAPRRGGLRP